jgi:hypothetical protein
VGNSCSLLHQLCEDAPSRAIMVNTASPFQLHFSFLPRSPGKLASIPSHHVVESHIPLHFPVLHLVGIEGEILHSAFGC